MAPERNQSEIYFWRHLGRTDKIMKTLRMKLGFMIKCCLRNDSFYFSMYFNYFSFYISNFAIFTRITKRKKNEIQLFLSLNNSFSYSNYFKIPHIKTKYKT